jgi:hypothetical protein
MSTETTPDITETERTMNALLRDDLQYIDGRQWEDDRERAARSMERRLNTNLQMSEFEGMRVQIELQPARARLVKVGL